MKSLPPHFVDLTKIAALKAFWRKNSLKFFLRQNHISEKELSTWDTSSEETKSQYLDRLFYKLIQSERGYGVIFEMAKSLAEMRNFPDLEHREDTKIKIAEAKEAVSRLKSEFNALIKVNRNEKEIIQKRMKSAEDRQTQIQQQQTLEKLKLSMEALIPQQGTQQGGYDFEKWFYELSNFFDIDSSPPYKDANGRQIDGSITVDGTTYLVETKFTKGQTMTTDVDSFLRKIHRKADNTMGIMVSMAGYEQGAIDNASTDRTTVLLLDYSHLYRFVFSGSLSLKEVVRRISRHASQTGNAYLSANDFSQ